MSAIAMIVPSVVFGAQQPNPRGGATYNQSRSIEPDTNASIRRSATSVIARNANTHSRQNRAVVVPRPGVVRSGTVRSLRDNISVSNKSRATSKPTMVRSGTISNTKTNGANVSRAATARATAVFNDVTKIGGGYANCRDAYATCMDQFCANANDTYRRCFCSDKFSDFRDTSDNLDAALKMLAEFQDNNLNAIDKTPAEVNAMYTASAGEAAIKKDTSASQKLLDSIGDVLSGKSAKQSTKQVLNSIGVLDLSGFGSDDIFGGSSSIFGGGDSVNLSEMEGKELYENAAKQCIEITRDSCGGDAMFNLARSAYSIMITQDCNAYEKNINAKKASVEETVRTAEKYLRDARLEEYRAHNSQDVNECLSKVETAMTQSTACGPNYEKCMDYTGLYINSATGEPIYSQALFGLNNLIKLDGGSDVLGANPSFDKWLDEKKMFAETALDTCRDKADTVWYEFKRAAIIKIAQAQDERIEKIKDTCVMTVKQCYDDQTGALKSMNDTDMQSTDAVAAVAARGMCYERVQACAALYGDPNGCAYDDATKKLTAVSGKKCGLQSLLAYVDTVDAVKVAEGCETALTKYAHEICPDEIIAAETEDGEDKVIPYGACKDKSKDTIRAAMNLRKDAFCVPDLIASDTSNTLQDQNAFNTDIMNQIIQGIYDDLHIAFTAGCENDTEINGIWVTADNIENLRLDMLSQDYYKKYYGKVITSIEQITAINPDDLGWCIQSSASDICDGLGSENAQFNWDTGECELLPAWYGKTCETTLHGQWDERGQQCYINNIQDFLK